MKAKKLGLRSQIADSILRFMIKNYESADDVIVLYNRWLQEEVMNANYPMNESSLITFALEQFEACKVTPKSHLITCKEIEDSVK